MSVLVVGTVAQDTIETPYGSAPYVLGGSATYFSWAASFFTKVNLVGVVGEDFPPQHRKLLADRGVDLAGLEARSGGKTFYWKGRYHANMNDRDTLDVQLNVIADYQPVVPPSFRQTPYVFLANSSPLAHMRVLEQMDRPRLVVADTMDFWIQSQKASLLELLPKLDGLVLNDSEAKLLSGEQNLIRAGERVRAMGPRFVIVKKGEHGSYLLTEDGPFLLPGYPTGQVVDPTGAGDSFAGGMMGYLAADGSGAPGSLRRGIAYGSVIASLTVEDFGLERLRKATRQEIDQRMEEYRSMLAF